MPRTSPLGRCPSLMVLASACGLSAPAPLVFGAVVYETADPFGAPLGGFDVSIHQAVAVRFIPAHDHTLDSVSLWFMNNDSRGDHPEVRVRLRDGISNRDSSVPGHAVLEEWTFSVSAVGWNPQLEVLQSQSHPLLVGGREYWICASSNAFGGLDGVWNWAGRDTGFVSLCVGGDQCTWSPGGNGAVAATIIRGTPRTSPPDVNDDGLVNGIDLGILLSQWFAPPGSMSDLNGDGFVNGIDLGILLAAWTM